MSKPVIKRTYVHWRGSFVAIGGTVWEVEILRPEKVLTPVELDFPADEPLIIEWDDITPESCRPRYLLGVIPGAVPGEQSLRNQFLQLCDFNVGATGAEKLHLQNFKLGLPLAVIEEWRALASFAPARIFSSFTGSVHTPVLIFVFRRLLTRRRRTALFRDGIEINLKVNISYDKIKHGHRSTTPYGRPPSLIW